MALPKIEPIKFKSSKNSANGQHLEEIVYKDGYPIQVRETYEYDRFKDLGGNRDVSESHVKQIVSSMRNEFLIVPILVNEDFEVIDGQHRLCACKQLEYPVYYIVVPGYGLKQTQMLNANQKDWNFGHYAESYAKQGIFDYQEFIRFKRRYKFSYTDCMSILQGHEGHNQGRLFKDGKFKIKDITEAQNTAKKIVSFEPYYSNCKRTPFVRACLKIFGLRGYDHDRMLQKAAYQGGKIIDSTTVEGYLRLLEDVYNSRVSENQKQRFF